MLSHEDRGMSTAHEFDRVALERAGKKEVLKREWGLFTILAFSTSTLCTWESTSALFVGAYTNGGPASVVYGFIISIAGTLSIGASMAEMASISPVAGAQYHWTAEHSPPKLRAFLSWMQGWVTILAWQATAAAASFLAATMIQALVIFNYPAYVPERWHATVMMIVIAGIGVLGCTVGKALLPFLESLALILHLLFFLLILVALLATGEKAENEAVWQTFINAGGWPNEGVSFCIGFMTPAFALAGVDAVVHMSEETNRAALNIPRAMLTAISVNSITAFAYIITLLYCIIDVDAVLANGAATGFPIIEVFSQATRNPRAATAMMCAPIIMFCAAIFGTTASTSRLIWAFARDKGLPFSSSLSTLTDWNKAPTRAILVSYTVTCLLSLINIGSTVAFNALLSLATLGFYASYAILISVFTIRRHSKTNPIRFGPWRMSNTLGMTANYLSLAFCLFLILFLPFPPILPVTATNMNWASVVFIGVMAFAVVHWFCWGQQRFVGPVER